MECFHLSLLGSWLVLFMAALALPADEPKRPGKEHFKIFVLIGQSNMAGRGKIEAEDRMAHPRVLMFSKEDQWAPAVAPLHFDKPQAVGVGPGLSFGKAVADALPEETIGLVPCAVGGTSMDQWHQGGKLYKEAVRRTRLAIRDGTLAGILWHQGEADGKGAGYADKALKLFTSLRQDLEVQDLPIVVGTLGEWRENSKEMNDVLRRLPETVPHCGVADAKGLTHKGDKTHFDAPSARELGKRYAAEWLKLKTKHERKLKVGSSRGRREFLR